MAKKAGLGRGLDALFADVAPINEEISVLDNLPGAEPKTTKSVKKAESTKAPAAAGFPGTRKI